LDALSFEELPLLGAGWNGCAPFSSTEMEGAAAPLGSAAPFLFVSRLPRSGDYPQAGA